MEEAMFDAFVSKFNLRSSGVASPQQFVATQQFSHNVAAVAEEVKRDDVRSVGTYAGGPFPIPEGGVKNVDIFGDISQHRHVAATFAILAQKKSGFDVNTSNVNESFQKYLDEFVQIHWKLLRSHTQTLIYDKQNHGKFMTDLVNGVTEEMIKLNAGEDTTKTVVDSIKSLAKRVALTCDTVESETLYTSMTIVNEDKDVYFTIFFTPLEMRHHSSAKSEVLSTSVTTYSVIMALNSEIVIQNADIYNRLVKYSVNEFVTAHTFPEPKEIPRKD